MPTSRTALAALLLAAAAFSLPPEVADAAARGGFRGAAPTSINRHAGANRASVGNRADVGNRVNRNSGNREINNSGNRINTGDVNINVDHDHGWDWDDHYHPVARGVAIGTAAAVTAAVVGSMIYSLPPACSPYRVSYYYCGGVYYAPRYEGDTVVYVVVDRPG